MDFRYAKPEDIGLNAERLNRAREVIERGLESGQYPGAVYIIGRQNGILEPACFGNCGRVDGFDVTPDTIYDVASLTKPIATATSLLALVELGEIHLRQKVLDFLKGKPHPNMEGVTLKHLLTHTSGLPAWKDFCKQCSNKYEIIDGILSLPLENEPGRAYKYSCLGYILLGAVVEAASGRGLDEFSQEHIFLPLGMKDTLFRPGGERLQRVAATANCPERNYMLIGEVHDSNAWAMGGVSGNAGLFSTAIDLARFASMILADGDGVFSPAAVRLMRENQIDPAIGGHTAGWFVYPNDMIPAGDLSSIQAIGHTGFTGTSVVVDPVCDLFVILLTNRVCNSVNPTDFSKSRRLFYNAVVQSVPTCR